jgi:DNA-binding IclR family transcriptional regulator
MSTLPSRTVLKAFTLLELFLDNPHLGATEAAALLGTPRASTHRLLISLRAAGMLETVEGGRYRLSTRLFELGARVPLLPHLMEDARRPLEVLTELVGVPALLGVREGTEVLFVDRFSHRDTLPNARMGSRGPLHATAIGKVLLASAPPEILEQVLAGPLEAFTPYTVTDPRKLLDELEVVRERGVAHVDQERRIGIVSTAVPIRDRARRVIAAVDIPGPPGAARQSRQEREFTLRRAAAEIERAIRLRGSRRQIARGAQREGAPHLTQ